MSQPHRTRGAKVLKAVSSPLRLQFLNLLFENALSYTELMNALKMNPSRDAGRFAYHLKFLLKTNLVEADVETKKYYLTDLGKMIIDVADRVERNAQKTKAMLVRTSHSTLEEFDQNKITNALIKEAKMPADQAQKTAKETEKLLQKAKTKYVTAPLIREIVNTLLIEKGQEDYRHKLTRLGLPVHEVTALIETKDTAQNATTIITKAGKTIFNEYTLLNVLPRDIADAHASGAIHLHDLSTWLLKPDEIIHDLRFFLQNGLKTTNPLQQSEKPPGTFEQALSLTFSILLHASQEVNQLQTLESFNTLLAPFAKNANTIALKQNLQTFINSLHQHLQTAINLDLTTPAFLADKPATGPEGKPNGKYADYRTESQLIATLIIEIISEESTLKPLINPRVTVKINNDALKDEPAKTTLLKAHALAAERGILYFVNTSTKEGKTLAFSGMGSKFEADLTGDFETDTLRTGTSGTVTINLPRIVQESEKDRNKLNELIKERYELATRALDIKARNLKQREKMFLPFLTQKANGDEYFRLESCAALVNFAGYQEAAKAFSEASKTTQDKTENPEIMQTIVNLRGKTGRKHGKRVFSVAMPNAEVAERLARLDIEKFGAARIKFSGTREKPFYTATKRLQIQPGTSLSFTPESIAQSQVLNPLNQGGSLTVIELGQTEYKSEDLMNLTTQLLERQTAEFFTYNRTVTYCSNCNQSKLGTENKCPSCGATSTLNIFDRYGFS